MSVASGEWISINQLCQEIPGPAGRGLSRSTAMRRILMGVGGVKLESVKVGGTRYVSREALNQFIAARNTVPAAAVQAERNARDAERTEQLLKAEGF